jgi:hypothetical protein
MAGEVQVASTTDSQDEVNRVAGAVPEDTVIKEAPDEQVDSEKQESPPEKPKVDPTEKMQKRIDKLTAQKSEAERRAEQLAKELEAERSKHIEAAPVEEPVEVPQAELRKRPKLGETINPRTGKPHETQEEYEDDLMDWRDERNAIEYAKSEQTRKANEVLTTYNDRVEEFKATHEDFADVVGKNIEIPQGVQMAILEMENGPEVAYFLGLHPEVCRDLLKMSQPKAILEIAKMSARLEEPAKKDEGQNQEGNKSGPDRNPVVSRAPAPIKPLTGHAVKSTVSLDQLDYAEYRRIRDKQEKERFRR